MISCTLKNRYVAFTRWITVYGESLLSVSHCFTVLVQRMFNRDIIQDIILTTGNVVNILACRSPFCMRHHIDELQTFKNGPVFFCQTRYVDLVITDDIGRQQMVCEQTWTLVQSVLCSHGSDCSTQLHCVSVVPVNNVNAHYIRSTFMYAKSSLYICVRMSTLCPGKKRPNCFL